MASFARSFRGFSRAARQTCAFRRSGITSHGTVKNTRVHLSQSYGFTVEVNNLARQVQKKMTETVPLSAACSILLGGLPLRAVGVAATSDGSSSDLMESSGSDEEGLVIPLSPDEDL